MSGNLNPNLFRLSLPEWLKEQVSSGVHKSVFWIDEKEKVFHVPWKHASRNGWEDGDVSLFKAWAIYTNRYREGIDKPKPALWKTNFRCAINSHNHIFFVKDQGERRGDTAHRIMKIVDQQENCKPQESSAWEAVKKRVRMTYPSAGEPTRKRSKTGAKETECENCKNNNSDDCPVCHMNNNNNLNLPVTEGHRFEYESGGSSTVSTDGTNTSTNVAIRKPNLQDLCMALKSMDDPGIPTTQQQQQQQQYHQQQRPPWNSNIKREEYEDQSCYPSPTVKQEREINEMHFPIRSAQTPVIVSNMSHFAAKQRTGNDDSSDSPSDEDDDLITPRIQGSYYQK